MPGDKNDDFESLMTGVQRNKTQHHHASRRSSAALHLDLRRDPDHQLAHLTRAGQIDSSSRQMDARTLQKVKQGKYKVDAEMDLHGMTLDHARTAFRHLVAQATSKGQRCILVITGKGDLGGGTEKVPARGGIRRALPIWAAEKPLDHLVLQVVPAAPTHGGTGAFYVILRRQRD